MAVLTVRVKKHLTRRYWKEGSMSGRRELSYEDWDAVLKDLALLTSGYAKHGKWNLEQAAGHLKDWLTFPMDGFPAAPWYVRVMLSAVRATMGKSMLRKILETGKMKDGLPTTPETVYEQESDEDAVAAVQKLRETIQRFREFDGPIVSSPLFGPMDKTTAEKMQLVHFAHHLSWLVPTAE